MQFSYKLKYGDFKRLTIKISRSGQIIVSAPYSYDETLVAGIISEKKDWIIKHLINIETLSETAISPQKGEILYLGELYKFEKNTSVGKTYFINQMTKIIVSGVDLTEKTNLLKFYKERSIFILIQKIISTAAKYGFIISKAHVRNTKKRWGSCTSKKVVTLSGRLIMAPDFVIEAIILHELTHTKIMNHSKNFYAELQKICPFYDEACRWLKEKMPPNYPPDNR